MLGRAHASAAGAAALFLFLLLTWRKQEPVRGGRCGLQSTRISNSTYVQLGLHNVPAQPGFSLVDAWVLKSEAARYSSPPREIPPVLLDDFTMQGRIPVSYTYYDNAYLGGKALVWNWTREVVETYLKEARARTSKGFNYPMSEIYQALDLHASGFVAGKRGVVIGSENPWAEAVLLEYGATHVTTIEFGKIVSEHPQLSTYTATEFTAAFLTGSIEPFDFAFTFSSLEHDGLGRYGDSINPRGDFYSVSRLLSVVRPGGALFLGVPCCYDALNWNGHRVYGSIRLAQLFAGWFPVDVIGKYPTTSGDYGQPLWFLQNRYACEEGNSAIKMPGILKGL
ncbi:hypothetical protein DFJ74DRAFT_214781 [Hyaloraphidium curvatum]|nr:hypothetical protein DFJ74DRAFT_214781 [Hyaloraphidium curvatum]